MDDLAIWLPIVIICVLIIWISIFLRVRQQRQFATARVVASAPVVVTSATHTAPGGYPVTQLPPPGYPPNPPNVYSPAPYPAQTTGNVTVQMPMPQPGMPTHGVTPYPPMPQPGSMNPPSYDMAVANPGPSVIPSSYEKQAPYNPTYGQ
ncbi:extensin isoform X8 [Drosophila willistoni]|uniref:extensin isoform X8 n=1 Tax=Drosophila willistoni TaxID=7260 RepID=UPI001F071355|nr:extensin isoform X8 [Drosophila willistoni]